MIESINNNLLFISIVFIIVIYAIIQAKRSREEKKAKMKVWRDKQEKERKELEKLRQLKEEEDKILYIDVNVICDDGIERKYSESMYGIIIEVVKQAYNKESIKNDFGINSYDVGINTKESFVFGNEKGDKTPLGRMSIEKWFDSKGRYLKSPQEIIKLNTEYHKKKGEYDKRYSLLNRRKISMTPYEEKEIKVINGIYFYRDWYLGYSHDIFLFNGILNGEKYINGYTTTKSVKNQTYTASKNNQDYVKSLIKYIKDEMNKTGQAWPISSYRLLFCKISFKDSENNSYVGQELRIQPGYKDDDKEIVELDSQIYTDSLCSQNSNGDLILITNGPSSKEDIQDLNHGNTEWYNWNDMVDILNKAKRINFQDLDDNLKSDFTYLDY